MGIITKSPKNYSSARAIKLSDNVFNLLEQYRNYWLNLRTDLSDYWKPFIEITLTDGSKQIVRNERLFIKDDTTPMNPDSLMP